ncbi:class I SAM-dependent methyltransferase [Candidatus Woesearchaeota archaeon]|nr:class I SAM-dependent methyltransferase [Candidatus Woesearchaeota archaeon]
MEQNNKSDNFAELFIKRWKQVKPPQRPSREELNFMNCYIEKVKSRKKPKVLVLGSTPELRDLALKNNADLISCDLNKEIWIAMKGLMKESGEEAFLHTNWLEIPEDTKFDLILGDGPINMLSAELVNPFFKKVASLLVDNGLSIQRVAVQNKKLDLSKFQKAMEDYRKNRYDMSVYLYTLPISGSIRQKCYPELTRKELFEKVLFKYMTGDEIREITPFLSDVKPYYPTKEELGIALSKYFNVSKTRESVGLGYWGVAFVYVLQKA